MARIVVRFGIPLVVIVLCLWLGGCGLAAKIDARQEYQSSLTEYRACLRSERDPRACENLRKLVVTNERAFNTMAAGIRGGNYSVSTTSTTD